MTDQLPDRPHKGRGAVSNAASVRFTALGRAREDDGWDSAAEDMDESPQTVVATDRSKRIITRNDSPDIHFDRSINPYKGCEHGCVYCFARPSHAYLDLSPGLDFETRIFAKPDAPALLRKELARRGYTPDVLVLGANTDPYQPVERRLEISRGVLEVLAEAQHPVCIVTKSALVLRDLDILQPMAERNLVRVMISVTTLERDLARTLEPRAPTPARRLAALKGLREAGVPAGVLSAPVIPALNDHELEAILQAAAEHGAERAGYVLLRLPHEIKGLFEEWLDAHAPRRKERVLNMLRECRGGQLYESGWGTRMKGRGRYAELIARRFRLACRKYGLDAAQGGLDTGRFTPPARDARQMSLL